jgi:hypothetical protein
VQRNRDERVLGSKLRHGEAPQCPRQIPSDSSDLATAKVFLFDLASLDVAYRVLSFIGLGGVLLASSFVAARFRASTGPADPIEPPADDASAAADQGAR